MSVLSKLPQIAPRINLDFTKGRVHPSIVVTRDGVTLRTSQSGVLEEVPANTPALAYVDGRCMGLQVYAGTTNLVGQSDFRDPLAPAGEGEVINWRYTSNTVDVEPSTESAPLPGGVGVLKITKKVPIEQINYGLVRIFPTAVMGALEEGLNTIYTCSTYVKAGTTNLFSLIIGNDVSVNNRVYAAFRLEGKGSIHLTEPEVQGVARRNYGIELVGDGWYRVWVSCAFDPTATYTRGWSVCLYPGVRSAQHLGDSVHVWGVQVEKSSAPTPLVIAYKQAVSRPSEIVKLADQVTSGTIVVRAHIPDRNNGSHREISLVGYGDQITQVRLYLDSVPLTTPAMRGTKFRVRNNSIDSHHTYHPDGGGNDVSIVGAWNASKAIHASVGRKTITGENPVSSKVDMNIGGWINVDGICLNGYIKQILVFSETLDEEQALAMAKIYK